MTFEKLTALFSGVRPPGVYRFVSRAQPVTLVTLAAAHGWRGYAVNGRRIHDKTSFLQVWSTTMHFPGYFGHNWDAFEESVTDLSWAPAQGYLLLYDHAANFAIRQPAEWATALAICQAAVVSWREQGKPFVLLLRDAGGAATHLPRL